MNNLDVPVGSSESLGTLCNPVRGSVIHDNNLQRSVSEGHFNCWDQLLHILALINR